MFAIRALITGTAILPKKKYTLVSLFFWCSVHPHFLHLLIMLATTALLTHHGGLCQFSNWWKLVSKFALLTQNQVSISLSADFEVFKKGENCQKRFWNHPDIFSCSTIQISPKKFLDNNIKNDPYLEIESKPNFVQRSVLNNSLLISFKYNLACPLDRSQSVFYFVPQEISQSSRLDKTL